MINLSIFCVRWSPPSKAWEYNRCLSGSPYKSPDTVLQKVYMQSVSCMIEIEKALYGKLDEALNKLEGNTSHPDSTMLGPICRRMYLLYRHEFSRCWGIQRLLQEHEFDILESQRHIESIKCICGSLVVAYSRAYHKVKSPYSQGWRMEDHSQEFGNDPELMQRFSRSMKAERTYCKLAYNLWILRFSLANHYM